MKIQSGEHTASKQHIDWELHKGHGPRTHREVVKFPSPFGKPPNVVVGLTMFDLVAGDHARVMVYVVNTEFNQFTIEYRTFGGCKVGEVRAFWLAYGE